MKRPTDSARYPLRAVLLGLAMQYTAYVLMQTSALFAETRRGPVIPDLLHTWVTPRMELYWVNSIFWLPILFVCIALLCIFKPATAVNYLRVGTIVTVLRGIFIPLTSLGPTDTIIGNAPKAFLTLKPSEITLPLLVHQWFPLDVLFGGSGLSALYLTQDLFFSGHTATTFLLIMAAVRTRSDSLAASIRRPWIVALVCYHAITVWGLVITHQHYTIDILGAYVIVYAVWKFCEARGWLLLGPRSAAASGQL
ncbi:MAG: hypothetical protein HY042_11100 [Spirochaetia bacterium]|nr:hypothetical protein [Spirochaetia bacterium]